MEYQIVTLFIIAILNAVFGYFVVRGGSKATNTIFSLVAISVSLWALNLAFFIKSNNLESSLIFANLYYIFAAAIPVLFFCFALVFPQENMLFKKKYYLSFIPLGILGLLMFLNENIILKEIFIADSVKDVVLDSTNYIIYGSYLLVFVLSSYIILLKKYNNTSDETEKMQLKLVIVGTAISYILGMFFNLLLPWVGNYSLIWLGPPFSLIMVASLGYAVIKHHLFNVKVISTEILTFSLIFFILVRTITSDNVQDQIVNGLLLLIVSIFGILLVRSVIKEVEIREQIEKLAEELKDANEQLKKMDKQKSEFINLASHQLRGPVASLKGYSSMILEGSYGPISKKIEGVVTRLSQSSNALALIIDDFLNLSRIERGKIEFNFTEGNLKEVVDSAVEELKQKALDKKLKLTFTAKKGNYILNMDAEKVRQIVSNLIDNSIKYTPKGSIKVHLSEDAGKVLLEVTDTGIGVPPQDMDKLFKKFSRLANANEENIQGTGLGLYLAKEVMNAHNGKIWIESEGQDKGSSFFVEFKTKERRKTPRNKPSENLSEVK